MTREADDIREAIERQGDRLMRRLDERCDRLDDRINEIGETVAAHIAADDQRFAALGGKPPKRTPPSDEGSETGRVRVSLPIPRWRLPWWMWVAAYALVRDGAPAAWAVLDRALGVADAAAPAELAEPLVPASVDGPQ